MTRWERLEEWLFDNDRSEFSNRDLAASLRIPRQQASRLIRAHLDAQRTQNSATLFVLKRRGRTTSAMWSVGQRTADAHIIGGTLFEDVSVKVRNAFRPDLERLAARNPRAARYCEQKIEAVVDGALVVLAASVDGLTKRDS